MARIQKKVQVEFEKQVVRERLLQSALDLFNKKGFASTSVREIVEAAGVTKPTLYYYFKNKEGIYLELMSRPFEVIEKILDESPKKSVSASERVLRLFDRIFLLFIENLKASRLMYSIYYGPPQGVPFYDFGKCQLKIRKVVGLIVRDGIKRSEFRAVDPEVLMWALNGALNFAIEEQLCHRSPRIDRKGLSLILELIFDGLSDVKTDKKR